MQYLFWPFGATCQKKTLTATYFSPVIHNSKYHERRHVVQLLLDLSAVNHTLTNDIHFFLSLLDQIHF